jgi:hypothetical protein
MLFNPDEERKTSGNENANRYSAGEATVELPINHDFATTSSPTTLCTCR